jgi:hypothetical protein
MRLSSAALGISTRRPSRRTWSSLRAISRSIVRRLTPSICAASCLVIAIGLLAYSVKMVSVPTAFLSRRSVWQSVSVAVQLGVRCRSRIEKVGRNLGARSGLIAVEIAQVQSQVQPNQPDTKTGAAGIEPSTFFSLMHNCREDYGRRFAWQRRLVRAGGAPARHAGGRSDLKPWLSKSDRLDYFRYADL